MIRLSAAMRLSAAHGFRASHRPPRLLFIAAILVGHGLLVLLLLDRAGASRSAVRADDRSSRIYITPFAPRPAVTLPAPEKTNPPAARARKPPEVAEERPAIPPENPDAPPAVPETRFAAPSIDWAQQAADAARRAAIADTGNQDFGDATRDETRIRRKPEAPARKESGHKAGDIEMVGPGIERRWISSACYWEFGRPPPLFAGSGPRVNQLHCKAGSAAPDEHLFDEIKPKYLKKKD